MALAKRLLVVINITMSVIVKAVKLGRALDQEGPRVVQGREHQHPDGDHGHCLSTPFGAVKMAVGQPWSSFFRFSWSHDSLLGGGGLSAAAGWRYEVHMLAPRSARVRTTTRRAKALAPFRCPTALYRGADAPVMRAVPLGGSLMV